MESIMRGKQVMLEVKLQNTGESASYSVPYDELVPVSSTDIFKMVVADIREKRTNSEWGAAWRPAATSRDEYIQNVARGPQYFRELAAEYPDGNNPNFFAFENDGGILDGGVCWWHSRFQRSALYLTVYLPNEEPIPPSRMQPLIWKIMQANEVVEIPGFNNFREFSMAYQEKIQKCLNATQILEGVFLFSWINGLAGLPEVSAEKMRRQMDNIYEEVTRHGLAYVKLQTPGIDSHAWLFTEMEKLDPADSGGRQGYKYKFIDSNYPGETTTWFYFDGDTRINGFVQCAPYLQRKWEMDQIYQAIDNYISNN
jgi:hypothetical protein